MKIRSLLFVILLFCTAVVKAEIKLASILGDNMVLQRNTEVKIWGKAKPGEKLTISASWSKINVSTV